MRLICLLSKFFYCLSSCFISKIIRIFNGCEVWIENSITRVTVQHHDACRVMLNSYSEWRNFQFEPNIHYRFFTLHTLLSTVAFRLEYIFIFTNFRLKELHFFEQDMFGSAPLLHVDVEMFGGNWHESDVKVKNDIKIVISPSCKGTFPSPVGFTEIEVGYARMRNLTSAISS